MHVGVSCHNRMNQTRVFVDSYMAFHSEISLVALFGLVHLWITFRLLILGGAGVCDQGGIDDRSLAHRHAPCAEVGFDRLNELLAQIVFLQLVTKFQDCGLIRDPALISSTPAKRHMVGTSIKLSSMAGSLS